MNDLRDAVDVYHEHGTGTWGPGQPRRKEYESLKIASFKLYNEFVYGLKGGRFVTRGPFVVDTIADGTSYVFGKNNEELKEYINPIERKVKENLWKQHHGDGVFRRLPTPCASGICKSNLKSFGKKNNDTRKAVIGLIIKAYHFVKTH